MGKGGGLVVPTLQFHDHHWAGEMTPDGVLASLYKYKGWKRLDRSLVRKTSDYFLVTIVASHKAITVIWS